MLVLHSRSGLWKIGGFTIAADIPTYPSLWTYCDESEVMVQKATAESESEKPQISPTGRGTPGYRAPELITDNPVYTTKVDIWGVGCILIELVSGSQAFQNDLFVYEYAHSTETLQIPAVSWPSFLLSHVQEISSELLAKDWHDRPRAAEAGLLFLSYRRLLDPPIAVALTQAQYLPTYHEWKEIVFKNPSELGLLSELAEIYDKLEHNDAAITIWKELVHRYPSQRQLPKRLADMYERKGDAEAAISGWSELVDKHPNDELLMFHLEEARTLQKSASIFEITCTDDIGKP